MEILAAIASLACVVVTIILARRLSGGQFVLTPANVYLILYVIFHFPLLTLIDTSYVIYAVIINLGLLGTVAGMYAANRVTKMSPVRYRRQMLARPLSISPDQTIVVLVVFASLVSLLFYRGLPPSFSILFDALSGKNVVASLLQMSSVRADLTKSHYFGGGYAGQGALKLINEMSWQLVAVFMYLRALTTRKWMHFFVAAVTAAIVVYGVGAKGPVAYIGVAILVARSFVVEIPLKRVIRYTVILLGFLLLVQSAQLSRLNSDGDEGFVVRVVTALSGRVVAGNGLNTYYLVDLLDKGVLEHQNGRDHFVKLLNSIPGVQYDTPYAHTLFWHIAEGNVSDKTTYATYTYVGGSYLDFGYLGVVLLSVLVGALLQLAFIYMSRLRWSTFNVAFSAVLTIHLGQIVAGSLISLPATLVAALIVFVVGSSPIAFGARSRRRQAIVYRG